MPIRIPDALPATSALERENIFVMTENRALHQDIRPLRLVLLNLMPTKIETETQILRKLSNTPLQIEVSLLQTASHKATNVSAQHLESFYTTFDQIKDERFDGLIITGAPVEQMDFEEVDYWPELCDIMAWSRTNVHSTLHICWGAQAGIYYHYGVQKYPLPEKMFGVFTHTLKHDLSPEGGELRIQLEGRNIDLAQFPYGTVLNTETLKRAHVPAQQKIRKVITVIPLWLLQIELCMMKDGFLLL